MRPMLLYVALYGSMALFHYTDKLTCGDADCRTSLLTGAGSRMTLQLMIGACSALAITLYYSGNFGAARQHTKRGYSDLALRRRTVSGRRVRRARRRLSKP